MFIYPMWSDETQRIGKQKCTPCGYLLHLIAELLEFTNLLIVFWIGPYLGYRWLSGTFGPALLWLLVVPFGVGLVSDGLYQLSWRLAAHRGFRYDYEKSEASWIENGRRVTFRACPEREDQELPSRHNHRTEIEHPPNRHDSPV